MAGLSFRLYFRLSLHLSSRLCCDLLTLPLHLRWFSFPKFILSFCESEGVCVYVYCSNGLSANFFKGVLVFKVCLLLSVLFTRLFSNSRICDCTVINQRMYMSIFLYLEFTFAFYYQYRYSLWLCLSFPFLDGESAWG